MLILHVMLHVMLHGIDINVDVNVNVKPHKFLFEETFIFCQSGRITYLLHAVMGQNKHY